MGHETRKRGATSSGAKLSRDSGNSRKKGGQGQKAFYFCGFFCGTHFCAGHDAKNYFFADNNTLCQELNIFANL